MVAASPTLLASVLALILTSGMSYLSSFFFLSFPSRIIRDVLWSTHSQLSLLSSLSFPLSLSVLAFDFFSHFSSPSQLLFFVRSSAGELTESEIENLKAVIENPGAFDIPTWFLNRQKDRQTGKSFQNVSNEVDTALRTDIERMKKIRYVFSSLLYINCLTLVLYYSLLLRWTPAYSFLILSPFLCFLVSTVVSVTLGTFVSVVNTLALLVVTARVVLLLLARRLKCNNFLIKDEIICTPSQCKLISIISLILLVCLFDYIGLILLCL